MERVSSFLYQRGQWAHHLVTLETVSETLNINSIHTHVRRLSGKTSQQELYHSPSNNKCKRLHGDEAGV